MRSHFQNILRGILWVVRKSRGLSIFVFYCILMTKFLEVFWGYAWGAPLPPRVYLCHLGTLAEYEGATHYILPGCHWCRQLGQGTACRRWIRWRRTRRPSECRTRSGWIGDQQTCWITKQTYLRFLNFGGFWSWQFLF